MKYYLLADSDLTAYCIEQAIAGDEGSIDIVLARASHLSEERAECQAMLDAPEDYASEGQHIIEFESDLDHEALCSLIFE